jgi:hypothetical protein
MHHFRPADVVQNLQILQFYIFLILQHFAAKL